MIIEFPCLFFNFSITNLEIMRTNKIKAKHSITFKIIPLFRMKTTMHCIVEDLEFSINKMEENVAFAEILGINIQGTLQNRKMKQRSSN